MEENFENSEKIQRKNYDSRLQTLKIIAIVFILLLSVAISVYLVISYFQNNKISFSSESDNKSQFQNSETNENNLALNVQDQQNQDNSQIENQNDESNSFQISSNPSSTSLSSDTTSSKNINVSSSNIKTQVNTELEKTNNASQTTKNTTNKTTNSKSQNITYVVQIASFTDFDKAISLKNKLEKAGISCYIVITEIDGKYYYRIRSGNFNEKKDAIALINKIKSIESSVSPIIIQK